MAKDDFDINFDFDQDFDFDPKAFLTDGEYDEDIDFSEFSEVDLDLGEASSESAPETEAADDDFDLDIDLDELLSVGDAPEAASFTEEELMADGPEFIRRERSNHFDVGGYGAPPEIPTDWESRSYEEDPELPEEPPVEMPEEGAAPDSDEAAEDEKERRRRERQEKREQRQREKAEAKAAREANPPKPTILTKFYDLYFAPVLNKELREEPRDPNNPRRRRRKSKLQIFKEVYLPPIVVGLTVILVLTFAIGSLTNFIQTKQLEKDTEASRLEEQQSAEDQLKQAAQAAVNEAELLASGYNYEDAIKILDGFLVTVEDPTAFSDITNLRSDYVSAQSQLVAHKDPSLIPNLSFHLLIHDMTRAKLDPDLSGQYNRNFVTTGEFSQILGELYNNGYVLVDFNSFTVNSNGTILAKDILLPAGKKPIMITETLTNYFEYMIGSDDTIGPDVGGDGFAHRLVVTGSGDIKAEYMDSTGQVQVGDYDLVPILESFIEDHPDFSYRGARAILAVTGEEGIFGWRINSTYKADEGDAYWQEQLAGAKELVAALREKGYTLAYNTYKNENYKDKNANQIKEDLQLWTQHITPTIGPIDVIVYAKDGGDIKSYSDNAFEVLKSTGFRYFVTNAAAPSTEVHTDYVYQKRLMVTGNTMAWKQDMFTGIFDPNAVIESTTRGQVPN